ncbi:MAG: hypothetical protein IPK88_19725 [Saprospiraceae bacterium]|uniref:Lipoprotein n=1 Tax=Candidatus Defluviibacterium haderslevense TaxID=2981993 RepID=A0A9D7S8X0_9BACT|nr:hypothetical protein [Candidatus Defluviibacterium haderslevense]MBK9718127.1 hypothetical protein [Candidatus Defluviibacterium haderslevense]MBL0237110.1 hypothetical protein [Candidatus Defluviibacterium haderslevense]
MKNLFLLVILSVAGIASISILSSCNSPAEKVENAQDKVAEANKDLEQANQEYLMDIDKYRRETNEKIAANEKIIADFNSRIEMQKANAKEDYKMKVAELEQKNTDLKKKMDDYKESGKEKWEAFKVEFNSDMQKLGDAFKNFTTDNKK